jgi:hypothetical protein
MNTTITTRPSFINFWKALGLHCRSSYTKAQKLALMRQQFAFQTDAFLVTKT